MMLAASLPAWTAALVMGQAAVPSATELAPVVPPRDASMPRYGVCRFMPRISTATSSRQGGG
jgi:hypothetical protein